MRAAIIATDLQLGVLAQRPDQAAEGGGQLREAPDRRQLGLLPLDRGQTLGDTEEQDVAHPSDATYNAPNLRTLTRLNAIRDQRGPSCLQAARGDLQPINLGGCYAGQI